MATKNNYYNIDNILKKSEEEKSNINIVYGGKSKGKSFQVKDKLFIKEFLETGNRFVLLRRFTDEVDKTKGLLYFRDYLQKVNLDKLTKGKFNDMDLISNLFYLVKKDKNKVLNKVHCGYYIPLSQEQNWSSVLSQADVKNIVFEEFQSRTTYLTNEIDKLSFFYSTVDREQSKVKMWLIGNAISKVCPYWEEYGLLDLIRNQKADTIEEHKYIHEAMENPFKILVEKTGVFNGKATIIDRSGAISKGNWYSEKQLKLYTMKGHTRGLLWLNFDMMGLKFVAQLNKGIDKKLYWFIWEVEELTKDGLTITDKIQPFKHQFASPYDIQFNDNIQRIINNTFRKNNIYFATDEHGTDFYKAICFTIRI